MKSSSLSPEDELHMMLQMKDLRKELRQASR